MAPRGNFLQGHVMENSSSIGQIIIVVPCYNEEHRLPVARFHDFIRHGHEGINFLLVNDGSTDGTERVIGELAAAHPDRVRAHSLAANSGKAEAVRQGLVLALQDAPLAVGFWDADLATPLDEIPTFLEAMAAHPEVEMVIGARVALLGRDIQRKRLRHYIGRGFATIASIYLGVGVYDTQCGAKLFRTTPMLHRILDQPFGARWLFDVELIVRFLKGYRRQGDHAPQRRIIEQPLRRWADVKGSKVKATDFPKALGELFSIMWRYGRVG
jgi:glycosyltransferase involved in cell wall biosynthesis